MILCSRNGRFFLMIASSLLLIMMLACAPEPPTATPTGAATPPPTPGLVIGEARSWQPDGCYLYTSPRPYQVDCEEWREVRIGDWWP